MSSITEMPSLSITGRHNDFSKTQGKGTSQVATSLKNGTLNIRGGDGNDKIELNRVPGPGPTMVQIKVNGEVMATVPYSQLRNVNIHGGNGNDNIKIDPSLSLDTTIYGGKGDDTIQGGGGADKIFGGAGMDKIDGGKGTDNIYESYGKNEIKLGGEDALHLPFPITTPLHFRRA